MKMTRRSFIKSLGVFATALTFGDLRYLNDAVGMGNVTEYGQISSRVYTSAYWAMSLLENAKPHFLVERFGKSCTIPISHDKIIKFRRYETYN